MTYTLNDTAKVTMEYYWKGIASLFASIHVQQNCQTHKVPKELQQDHYDLVYAIYWKKGNLAKLLK